MLLPWCVQNFFVISQLCYEQEHNKFSLNSNFTKILLGGQGCGATVHDTHLSLDLIFYSNMSSSYISLCSSSKVVPHPCQARDWTICIPNAFSVYTFLLINSLWPSDHIWWHRSGSVLAQLMACWLTAPSHYLNQCWLVLNLTNP